MIETLLNPFHLVPLVAIALLVGTVWSGKLESFRPWAFLALNTTLLATWFGGQWKGVGICFLFAAIVFFLLQRSRVNPVVWILTLLAFVGFLGLVKYDYPSWLPHSFTGGIWVRSFKGWLGIPDLKKTIGISYLCFRLIHVHIEYRAGNIARLDFLTYLNYVFFAPTNLAGPINHYAPFAHDLAAPQLLDGASFLGAMQRIVIGLAKKVLIAGLISPYILGSLEPSGAHPFLLLTIAAMCYSIYIYADFSGYTDIAIGLGRLFGIALPENFNHPFRAANIQEFWMRWHITLTDWVRNYVFFPLNLFLTRRYSQGAKLLNPLLCVITSFAIIGAWHGNHWNFLVFGLVHGAAICVVMTLRKIRPPKTREFTGFALLWRQALTFLFVSYSFIFFVYPLGDVSWLLRQALGAN